MGFLKGWTPQLLSVFRIIFALLFVEHATAKLFHFPHIAMFDSVQEALDFIKPTFNEEIRAGHANM